MSENLLHRIIRIPEDYGSVNIVALERNEGDLHLFLDVRADEDPDVPGNILIKCVEFTESTLAPRYYRESSLPDDLVLLWLTRDRIPF
jgi:hypothetical protein